MSRAADFKELRTSKNTPPPWLGLSLRYATKSLGNTSQSLISRCSHDSVPITTSALTDSISPANSSVFFVMLLQFIKTATKLCRACFFFQVRVIFFAMERLPSSRHPIRTFFHQGKASQSSVLLLCSHFCGLYRIPITAFALPE